eukprot:2255309-Prymnesium_polylepis.1
MKPPTNCEQAIERMTFAFRSGVTLKARRSNTVALTASAAPMTSTISPFWRGRTNERWWPMACGVPSQPSPRSLSRWPLLKVTTTVRSIDQWTSSASAARSASPSVHRTEQVRHSPPTALESSKEAVDTGIEQLARHIDLILQILGRRNERRRFEDDRPAAHVQLLLLDQPERRVRLLRIDLELQQKHRLRIRPVHVAQLLMRTLDISVADLLVEAVANHSDLAAVACHDLQRRARRNLLVEVHTRDIQSLLLVQVIEQPSAISIFPDAADERGFHAESCDRHRLVRALAARPLLEHAGAGRIRNERHASDGLQVDVDRTKDDHSGPYGISFIRHGGEQQAQSRLLRSVLCRRLRLLAHIGRVGFLGLRRSGLCNSNGIGRSPLRLMFPVVEHVRAAQRLFCRVKRLLLLTGER